MVGKPEVILGPAVRIARIGHDKSPYRRLEYQEPAAGNAVFQAWSFLFVSLVYWQNGKTRGAPATRWRSSVRVSAWLRGERSRPACGHSVSDG
jgi:hypothetical protein